MYAWLHHNHLLHLLLLLLLLNNFYIRFEQERLWHSGAQRGGEWERRSARMDGEK